MVFLLLPLYCVSSMSFGADFSSGRLPSSHGVDKLVHQSARHVRLPDDAFLVVLADGATQFVIVHSWPVLPDAP